MSKVVSFTPDTVFNAKKPNPDSTRHQYTEDELDEIIREREKHRRFFDDFKIVGRRLRAVSISSATERNPTVLGSHPIRRSKPPAKRYLKPLPQIPKRQAAVPMTKAPRPCESQCDRPQTKFTRGWKMAAAANGVNVAAVAMMLGRKTHRESTVTATESLGVTKSTVTVTESSRDTKKIKRIIC